MPQRVSALIPAYNEGGRVGPVVCTAIASGCFTEVIVIDDGSTDSTFREAQESGALVFRHEKNRGKPAAMLTGLEHSSESIVCFLDADLLQVAPGHLKQLIEPVLSGQSRAAIAVFKGGRGATTVAQKIAPMISGQRCLERTLLDGFVGWNTGFGIETAINDYLKRTGISQAIVYWDGASHVMKEEKRGFFKGLAARVVMFWQIFVTWFATKLRRS